jgi:hypothetical protein
VTDEPRDDDEIEAPLPIAGAVSSDPLVLSPADVADAASNLPAVVQPQHPYEFLPYSELTADDITVDISPAPDRKRGLVIGGLVALLALAVIGAVAVTNLSGDSSPEDSSGSSAGATVTTTTTVESLVPTFAFDPTDAGWYQVTSEDGDVQFEMPGLPRVIATAAGGQANLVAEGEGGIGTEVIYSPIKEEWSGDFGNMLAVLGVFERATDVVLEEPETVDGVTVIDANGVTEGGTVHARVIARDNFAITVIQRTPDSAPPQTSGGTWVRLVGSAGID